MTLNSGRKLSPSRLEIKKEDELAMTESQWNKLEEMKYKKIKNSSIRIKKNSILQKKLKKE